MKVLMQGRYELFDVGGGDKVQIENTANQLRSLGVSVDVATQKVIDLSQYDIVHIFQLDWVAENYIYAKQALKQGIPIVLSPIHHTLKEVERFDNDYAFGFRRLSKALFKNQFARDTFKNVYRSVLDYRKIPPTALSLILGLKNMHKKVLSWADIVLVQTNIEAYDLKEVYDVDFEWRKIPNGVSSNFIRRQKFSNPFEFEDYILCVGRIEPRKNQLSVIEAVQKLRSETNKDLQLVFVGARSGSKHIEYSLKFNSLAHTYPWVHYVGQVPYEQIPSYYHFAKVGVSASWFESTGLTSLEALFCGANAVACGSQAREYLGDLASYAEPYNIDSIKTAIKEALHSERPIITRELKLEYTWLNAAKKTLDSYNSVLAARKNL